MATTTSRCFFGLRSESSALCKPPLLFNFTPGPKPPLLFNFTPGPNPVRSPVSYGNPLYRSLTRTLTPHRSFKFIRLQSGGHVLYVSLLASEDGFKKELAAALANGIVPPTVCGYTNPNYTTTIVLYYYCYHYVVQTIA